MFWKTPKNPQNVEMPVQFNPGEWEFREFEGTVYGMTSTTSSSEAGQFWALYLDEERADPIGFSAGFSPALVFTHRGHHVKFVLRRRIDGPDWFEEQCDVCLVSFANFEQEMTDDNVPDPYAPAPTPARRGFFQTLLGRR